MSKILVIDDSGLTRRILRSILEPAGYQVIEASEGKKAIETFSSEKPDLTLLDLTMEDMHGLEVLKKLREIDNQVKVVIVTADIQSFTRKEAEEAGATAFLNKPLAGELVLGTVKAIMSGGKSETQ
jgi:two-component system chemotaxis response regulator CheY